MPQELQSAQVRLTKDEKWPTDSTLCFARDTGMQKQAVLQKAAPFALLHPYDLWDAAHRCACKHCISLQRECVLYCAAADMAHVLNILGKAGVRGGVSVLPVLLPAVLRLFLQLDLQILHPDFHMVCYSRSQAWQTYPAIGQARVEQILPART